ncbi:MAG: ribosomal subunit interface protein [Acidobacteriales bacterium 59-55]|uniref:ribosome hibernation-promoting factor, HPF/YfiA family n=1 Tax=Microbacterium sp. SCN 71-21 TaxID=1660116 RepID=UPI00086E3A71|nr:ribosome-associated translation inhibitor RaiA [Microbacterium sp. SCN 71-21]MBN9617827.1 ribosome-associated translation inhibitor RaiA [Terriglobales bacterium]ODU73435.1 MAG: ribosomal subunit interface protein [Microbacterium sp. SCN 71-21]OJV41048.1 MAG: ribosomal subunit interface protein [Acidobacteriales bacterium 59-55]
MDVEYTGRQASVTKKYKAQTEVGLARIVKIVGNAGSAHVTLSRDKYRFIAEITVQTKSLKLVATCESTEMATALRDALAKIEQQAIRRKKKKVSIKRRGKSGVAIAGEEEAEASGEIAKPAAEKIAVKASKGRKTVPMLVHSFPSHSPLSEPHVARSTDGVALRPMSLEEAVKEAAFRDRDVFVFRDHGGRAMVLHRKRDGKMELIEVP